MGCELHDDTHPPFFCFSFFVTLISFISLTLTLDIEAAGSINLSARVPDLAQIVRPYVGEPSELSGDLKAVGVLKYLSRGSLKYLTVRLRDLQLGL